MRWWKWSETIFMSQCYDIFPFVNYYIIEFFVHLNINLLLKDSITSLLENTEKRIWKDLAIKILVILFKKENHSIERKLFCSEIYGIGAFFPFKKTGKKKLSLSIFFIYNSEYTNNEWMSRYIMNNCFVKIISYLCTGDN